MTDMLDNWSTPYQQGEPFYGRSNWTGRSATVNLKHGDNRAGIVYNRPSLYDGAGVSDVPGTGVGCTHFQSPGDPLPGAAPEHGQDPQRGLAGTTRAIS